MVTCTFGKLLEIVQRAGSMGHGMKSGELREGDWKTMRL